MRQILIVIALTLFSSACRKNDIPNETLTTRIELNVPVIVEQITKATDKTIANVWVIQVKGDNVQQKEYITALEAIGSKYYFEAQLLSDNDQVYVIANTGDDDFYTTVTTKAELLDKEIEFQSATTGGNLPMSGIIASPQAGKFNKAPMAYLVSKVRVTVATNNIIYGDTFTAQSLKLINVPNVVSFKGETLYPAADVAKFNSTASSINVLEGQWYIGRNLRGTGTATAASKKTNITAPAGQSDYCTFVELRGMYQESGNTRSFEVVYRMWLGEDNITDYNVTAGVFYDIALSIRDAQEADSRVEIVSIIRDAHDGWAGSNIYWDGTKLTFDDVAVTDHEQYIGAFFKYGSLVAISPNSPNPWNNSSILFAPGDKDQDGNPWSPATNTGYLTVPSTRGFENLVLELQHFIEEHYPERNIGDICKWMTDNGLAPASPKGWRMPTAAEYVVIKDATRSPNVYSFPAITPDKNGMAESSHGFVLTDPHTFFPATGLLGYTGEGMEWGQDSFYWSATPSDNAELSWYCNFHPSAGVGWGVIAGESNKLGLAVRCVRHK